MMPASVTPPVSAARPCRFNAPVNASVRAIRATAA